MKLITIAVCLDYPCTINFNVLNDTLKDIPEPFKNGRNFPRMYNSKYNTINDFSNYLYCDVILLEQVSKNEYNISVY